MTPLVQIVADGENVTARVQDRLLDLRLVDEAGVKADTLSMLIDDRDGALAVPPSQSVVTVSLGIAGPRPVPLTRMGTYLIDAVELTGPVRRMRLSGTAAAMAGEIRAPRTRAWEDVTLGEMVQTIAAEANLVPAVAPELRDIAIDYVAQTAESDLHLLTRLARQNGAVVKPVDGHLSMTRRGSGTNATGAVLPVVPLLPADLQSWTWRSAERGRYASAEASWTDLATGTTHKVVVGDGKPRRVLRHPRHNEAEARRAAQAVLDGTAQGAETARVTCAGFRPDAFAGATVKVADIRPEWAGAWSVKTATHSLSNTLFTELELERPAPKGDPS